MQYVGKLDIDLYRCVSEDIATDEVIITEERIEHIIERRGKGFYEKYRSQFAGIIADPDYIFSDERENTALVCKRFHPDGVAVNLVVRLCIRSDGAKYKNSIITAIQESEKRFAQRLRNNFPLYKKE